MSHNTVFEASKCATTISSYGFYIDSRLDV